MTPDPVTVVLAGFTTVASAVILFFTLMDRMQGKSGERKITPQPLEISQRERMATFEELRDLRERVDEMDNDLKQIQGAIHDSESALKTEGSKRAASIHKRVDDLAHVTATALARLEERSTTTAQSVLLVNEKLDRLLEAKQR